MLKESKIFAESWNVAWREKKTGSIFEDIKTEFVVIKNKFRYWAADPFVFEYENDVYIFAELYDYVTRKGIIGYYKLTGNKKGKWIPIIKEKYHLSYPNIFMINKEIFIMPESNSCGELYLYRAISFPNKWEKFYVIRSNVNYADTTQFKWRGKQMALTYDVKDSYHPKLFLLDIEDAINDKEIISLDIKRKRPAGNVFCFDKRNIRPAQNCVNDYGKGLIFYEYGINSDNEYYENEILELKPSQLSFTSTIFLDGMHTYNSSEKIEVIDIKTRRFNIINFVFRFLGKILDFVR